MLTKIINYNLNMIKTNHNKIFKPKIS